MAANFREVNRSLGEAEEYVLASTLCAMSHERCKKRGLNPLLSGPTLRVAGEELRNALQAQWALLRAATPLLCEINAYLPESFVLLCDWRGLVIGVGGPDGKQQWAARGYEVGALLTEDSCGTNAVAFGVQYAKPVITLGEQHYLHAIREWSCLAMPIRSHAGHVSGFLAISTPLLRIPSAWHAARLAAGLIEIGLSSFLGVAVAPENSSLLTSRQSEVVRLLAQGMSQKEIAVRLGIKKTTLQDHLKHIYEKLEVNSQGQCVRKCIRLGLVHFVDVYL